MISVINFAPSYVSAHGLALGASSTKFHVCARTALILAVDHNMADHVVDDRARDDEEVYDENADEDFNPENAAQDEDVSSSDDETANTVAKPTKKTSKRKADVNGELDSGDEATIQERRRKKRKSKDVDAEDSGGEGGLIKTRAQRIAEYVDAP